MVGPDRSPALAPVPGVHDHRRMDEEGQQPEPSNSSFRSRPRRIPGNSLLPAWVERSRPGP